MDAEYTNNSYLESHLTHYTCDANLAPELRAEARRVLALEAAMAVTKTPSAVVKTAKQIETFLRGEAPVTELKEVKRSR